VIAAWMMYALTVSTLFGIGAVLLERAFRLARLQARGIWAGAMVASIVLPVFARSTPAEPIPDAPRIVVAMDAMVPAVLPQSEGLEAFHTPLLLLWLAGSMLVTTLIVVTHCRVAQQVRDYAPDSLHGISVRRTAGFGPAVVGLLRSVIVVPTWIDILDDDARALVLRHEQEHQRTGDSRLLFFAVLALALQPWNLALWWQMSRLREAMELDCDHRVIKTGVDLRAYGQLLLAMSRRRPPSPLAAVALSNANSTLDRRITTMTMHHTRNAYVRALCAASVGALLIALGCKTPSPVAVDDTTAADQVALAESVAVEIAATDLDRAVPVDTAASPTVNIDIQGIHLHIDSADARALEIDLDAGPQQIEFIKHLRTLYKEGAIELRPADGSTDECPTVRVVRVLVVGQDKEEQEIHITLRPCETDA
jgi:beta-lactamase regulating signal transducer with metallopeptidase domain